MHLQKELAGRAQPKCPRCVSKMTCIVKAQRTVGRLTIANVGFATAMSPIPVKLTQPHRRTIEQRRFENYELDIRFNRRCSCRGQFYP